jgi:ribosomal protein S18 acetylase RimI-like enzyme
MAEFAGRPAQANGTETTAQFEGRPVFAHNTAAIALHRKSGFAEEGRRVGQYRRASGQLWDSIVMGIAH